MSGTWLHSFIMWIHIAGGLIALLAGTAAIAVRKGGAVHASAGTWFCAAMLVLGVTAAILEPFRAVPGSPVGGIMVCYFVLTSWMTARRRDGQAGWIEKTACAAALGLAALLAWGGFTGETTPAGPGPLFALAGVCLLAGLGDLKAILRKLSPAQRISRHLWRMCLAFFIATGSFFLGQQDVLPRAVRGSPILFVLAFAPFAVMAFWLARIRFGKALARLKLRAPAEFDPRPRRPAERLKGPSPMLDRLFPRQVDNRFEGHRAALWLLGLLIALKLVVSLNSIFNTAAVAQGADGIPLGSFDPAAAREVLTLFALTALGQLILALVALAALVRWRALVPFLYLVSLAEQLARRFIVQAHDVTRAGSSPVAWYVTYGVLAVLVLGLVLSLLPARGEGARASLTDMEKGQ